MRPLVSMVVVLSACQQHPKDESRPPVSASAGDHRVPAFYGTTFGMTPSEVARVIPVKIQNCSEVAETFRSAGKTTPLEMEVACAEADDKVWAQRSATQFAFGLQLHDESFDAEFVFFDGRLFSVSADFSFPYKDPKKHYDTLNAILEQRLTAAIGPGSFEPDRELEGVGATTFKNSAREARLWRNPRAQPPALSLYVVDAAVREKYETEKRARDDAAIQ